MVSMHVCVCAVSALCELCSVVNVADELGIRQAAGASLKRVNCLLASRG